MGKTTKFDSSCEFNGVTPEELLQSKEAWDSEATPFRIGGTTIHVHPSRKALCKETTGYSYKRILKGILLEFSDGGNEEEAIRNLFEHIGIDYSEDKVADVIDYVVCAVVADCQNVLDNKDVKVHSFKAILDRDRIESVIAAQSNRG